MKVGRKVVERRGTNEIRLLAMMLLIGSLCGCISNEEGAESEKLVEPVSDKVNVVATTVPLGHFTEMVGGDRVNVAVLVQPGTNLHTFDPSPSQLKGIEDAHLYVKNGAGLEMWMDKIIQANREMLVVDSSQGVDLIEAPGRDHGLNSDDHGTHQKILTADPHIWLSPRNAMIQVENICRGLIEVDPGNRDYYIAKRDNYIKNLSELDEELNATFADAKGRKFLVLHPAWSYLARDYGLEQIPVLFTEKEPGPKYLVTVIETARENNITTVFVDPNFNPKSAEIIAKEIGGQVMPLDPLADNYLENMRLVGKEIAASLR